jgi:hypothetical protein
MPPKNGGQAAGYSHLTKLPPKSGSKSLVLAALIGMGDYSLLGLFAPYCNQ